MGGEARGHPLKFYGHLGYIPDDHEIFDFSGYPCTCLSCLCERDGTEPEGSIPMQWNGTETTNQDGLLSMRDNANPTYEKRSWFLQPIQRDDKAARCSKI